MHGACRGSGGGRGAAGLRAPAPSRLQSSVREFVLPWEGGGEGARCTEDFEQSFAGIVLKTKPLCGRTEAVPLFGVEVPGPCQEGAARIRVGCALPGGVLPLPRLISAPRAGAARELKGSVRTCLCAPRGCGAADRVVVRTPRRALPPRLRFRRACAAGGRRWRLIAGSGAESSCSLALPGSQAA